jgi:sugar phosphate isomerase/epimerase
MSMHRRDLFRTAGAAALGYSLASHTAHAIEPIQRIGKPSMRLSLAAYSFRQWLDLKKKDMTLFDFIDMAAGWPLDAVELTAYYFEKTTPEYLAALKGRCTKLGLDISGTAVGNDFCVTDPEALKKQIASVKQWVEHTSLLGGKTIRIFAGTLKKGDKEERAIKQAVEAMQEACEHAGKYGIYLALENHGGITATPEQLLSLVRAVKSDWFGVNLDSGNFHTEDPYGDLAKIAPYAVIAQFKTEIHPKGKPKEEADLGKLVEMMRKVNYRGYVALEYEAAENAKTAVPRHLAALRKLIS